MKKQSFVKVIRKQGPISTRCLDFHPSFRVVRGCKECKAARGK